MKRKYRVMAIILVLGLVFTACGEGGQQGKGESTQTSSAVQGDTIRIGGIFPETGAVSDYGITTENGIQLAVKEINENGGILGKPIEWISYDNQGDVTQTVNAYNKLMEEGVDAIAGPNCSKPCMAAAETAVNDGILLVTPTGGQTDITEGKPNVFRICYSTPYQGTLLAIYAHDKLQAKTYAIISNSSSDYSQDIAEGFKEKADSLGLAKVAEEGYSDNDTDFKAQLTKIQAQKADVLLVPDYYEKDALIVSQAREMGISCPVLGGDGWDGILKVVDRQNYADLENCFFTDHFSPESDDPRIKNFIKNYKEAYGDSLTAFSALGYDTIYSIKEAMEAAKTTERQAVVQAMHQMKFEGITGSFSFDENNNPDKSAYIIRIQDGQYRYETEVKPD